MADAPKKGSRTSVTRPAMEKAPVGVAKAASVRAMSPKPTTQAKVEPAKVAKPAIKSAKPLAEKAVALSEPVIEAAPVKLAAVAEPVAAARKDVSEEVLKDAADAVPVTGDVPPAPEVIAAVSGGTEAKLENKEPARETEPEAVDAPAQGMSTMNDMMQTGKQFAEDAKAKFETAFAQINEKAKAGVEKSTKAMEEMSELAKGNVEALVESGKIAAKGMETLGQDAAEYSRKSFEKATATMKSFASVKTPAEFFQLQSELLSSTFDAFAKETAKNSEAMLKLAGDVAQPISTRVSVVTEKVKALAA